MNGFNVFSEEAPVSKSPSPTGPKFEGWFPNREDADAEVAAIRLTGAAAWCEPDTAAL